MTWDPVYGAVLCGMGTGGLGIGGLSLGRQKTHSTGDCDSLDKCTLKGPCVNGSIPVFCCWEVLWALLEEGPEWQSPRALEVGCSSTGDYGTLAPFLLGREGSSLLCSATWHTHLRQWVHLLTECSLQNCGRNTRLPLVRQFSQGLPYSD